MKKQVISILAIAGLLLSGCASTSSPAQDSTTPQESPSVSASATPSVSASETPSPEEPTTSDLPTQSESEEPTPSAAPEESTPVLPSTQTYGSVVPESAAVSDDWFADALFIGDSRTDGLRLYSGLTCGDYFWYNGLTVFEVVENKPVIQVNGERVGVLDALRNGSYAKIYLTLGLNELGYNNDQGFADAYKTVVEQLKLIQPSASIYLQTIIPVNPERCVETDQFAYITNEQIANYNAIIAEIAEELQVNLLNPGEVLTDESGVLPYEASADGIHFHKEGYAAWYQYLKTHTGEGV